MVAAIIVTAFQFATLYRDQSIWTRVFTGPFAFHFTLLEVVLSLFFINLLMGKHLVTRGLASLLFGFHLTCLYIQFMALYFSNDFVTLDALQVSSQVGLLLTPFVLGSALLTVGLPWFVVSLFWLIKRDLPHLGRRPLKSVGLQSLFIGIFGLVVMQSYHLRIMRDLKWEFPAQKSPPTEAFIQTLDRYFRGESIRSPRTQSIVLNKDDLETLKAYGLPFPGDSGSFQDSSSFPLIKPEIYRIQLPERHSYNVITIFAESLSARLMGVYGGTYNQLTPHIDRFGEESLVVDGYINHAFPTIPALTGTLCSIFPNFSHTDWAKAKSKLSLPMLFCLPQLLNQEGYETYYLGYSHPRETFFREQMLDFGIQNPLFYEELSQKYLGETPEQGAYGNSDRQMFGALKGLLMERQRQLTHDKGDLNQTLPPFYMAISTIETHAGMDVTAKGKVYRDGKNRTLNTFHNFDTQFGIFMEWFQQSEFANNTIIILTADHAHPPSVEFGALAGSDYLKIPFDRIPLIIKMPGSKQGTRISLPMTSLDYAPTVAQILGIKNQPNHFLGHALYDLQETPYQRLGMVDGGRLMRYGLEVNVSDVSLEVCLEMEQVEQREQTEKTPLAEECRLTKGIYYLYGLMAADQAWPRVPLVKLADQIVNTNDLEDTPAVHPTNLEIPWWFH